MPDLIERIKELLKRYERNICFVCGRDFDECNCFYDFAEKYLDRIEELIKDEDERF